MAGFYPAFLALKGRAALVVGGGAVAAGKARTLAEAGARVTIVAPRVLPEAVKAGVRVLRRPFRPSDIGASWLVVAATDDEALNARVSRLCAARRIWVNVADRPGLCSFIVPAVTRRGPVTFAVSTGGASPALAAHLKKRVAKAFGPEVAAAARLLARLRPRLKALPMAARKSFLARALARAASEGYGSKALRKMENKISSILQGD